MVTTQVVLDCETTCGTAVCVVSFNTNLSNLPNRAGYNLQVGGNLIRVSFNTNRNYSGGCCPKKWIGWVAIMSGMVPSVRPAG